MTVVIPDDIVTMTMTPVTIRMCQLLILTHNPNPNSNPNPSPSPSPRPNPNPNPGPNPNPNPNLQRDIYESLAAGSHSCVLANLAAALDGQGARLTNYDKEVRQRKWYLQVMHQTEAEP